MRSVRINYSKSGRAIYISHLDLNRMMSRALRRAKLPMWYTEGFNPHPYITFALPLSLGQSSDCEFMDIRIEGEMTNDEVRSRLEEVLPEGFDIISVYEPVHDAKDIAKAMYFVKVIFADENEAKLFAQRAEELVNGEELIAEKSGKKGHRKVMKQVNLIDYIYDIKITSTENAVNLQCTLAAGNTNNLNPALLVETIEKLLDIKHSQMNIMRKKLVTDKGAVFK